jgi:transcriptional regulator with XRE-family HTH domain
MEERLVQLLKSEGINPTRFAERIGVQRSSISHILSGRNKPSYDFIIKILDSFPAVNPDWLLRGKGLMYKNDVPVQPGLFDNLKPASSITKEPQVESTYGRTMDSEDAAIYSLDPDRKTIPEELPKPGRKVHGKKIDKVVIFYSDRTFSDYLPDIDLLDTTEL